MFGLAVVGVFFIYLLLCAGVVGWAVKAARKRGIKGWKWGVPAALFMYLIVFWDHIPTLLLHHYYCATKAGYWVYKSPEQWKKENPGVAETLTWVQEGEGYFVDIPLGTTDFNGVYRQQLNERFVRQTTGIKNTLFPLTINTTEIKDIATGSVVVKMVTVTSGYGAFSVGGSWKFWVGSRSCSTYPDFKSILIGFRQIGRETL